MNKIVTTENIKGRAYFGVDGHLVSRIVGSLLKRELIKRETPQIRQDIAKAIVCGHHEIDGTDNIEVCWYGNGRLEIVRYLGYNEDAGEDEFETIARIRYKEYSNI